MKRPVMTSLTALTLSGSLAAAVHGASTEDVLAARRVRDQIAVELDGKTLRMALDGRPLKDHGTSLRITASEPIAIVYRNYNPLRVEASATAKTEDDPSQAAFNKLFAALVGLPPALGFELPDDVRTAAEIATGAESAIELRSVDVCATIAEIEDPCNRLHAALYCLDRAITDPVVSSADELDLWRATATGRLGIAEVAGLVGAKAAAGDRQVKRAEQLIELFDDLARSEGGDCAAAIPFLVRLANPGARLEPKRALVKALTELAASLGKVATPNNWTDYDNADGSAADYRLLEVKPEGGKIAAITVQAKEVSHSIDQARHSFTRTVSSDKSASATVHLHKHSWFVPEIAAGMILTGIEQDEYGTGEDDDGNTVIELSSRDELDYKEALLFNAVMRAGGSPVHPLWQLGASSQDDRPALLFGGGVRLTKPAALAVTGGAILAWVKRLDSLAPGDPVDGTAEIEDDLTREADLSWYFSIQWTF